MNTISPVPEPDGQPQHEEQTVVVPAAQARQPLLPPVEPYYLREEDEEQEEDQRGWSGEVVTPFQPSAGMPVVQAEAHSSAEAPEQQGGPRPKARRGLSLLRVALIVLVIIVALGLLWMTVFAQPTAPISTAGASSTTGMQTAAPPTRQPTQAHHQQHQGQPAAPTRTTAPTTIAAPATPGMITGSGGDWVPQSLPAGWTAAGLSAADAVFAERTAWTFTDREEALDYRNVGTRAQHAGTFTAATFLLTAGAKERFVHNDVRVITNTLFDHVQQVHLIQAAVNAVPHLVSFQTQGQQQLALVEVSYQLYQSQVDPGNPEPRIEGLSTDPATGAPRLHHMSVLLVRVPPQTQGPGAPMGGSGWLVSNYGLDLPSGTALEIVQPV